MSNPMEKLKERFPLAVSVVDCKALRRVVQPQNKSCQGSLTGIEPKHQLKTNVER